MQIFLGNWNQDFPAHLNSRALTDKIFWQIQYLMEIILKNLLLYKYFFPTVF